MPFRSPSGRWLAIAAMALACGAAQADRPFLATTSALAEDDDERVWSVATWAGRLGDARSFDVAAEYAFSPTTSAGFGLTRSRAGGEWGSGAEVEVKHLFQRSDRHGWGWGLSLSLEGAASRARAGSASPWPWCCR